VTGQQHPLASVLAGAARGVFPAPDGTLAVLPAPPPYCAAVVAFTAHSFVAAELPEDEVRGHLRSDDLGAPVSAPFLAWLGQRLGTTPGVLDAVLVHVGPMNAQVRLVPGLQGLDHPRVAKARDQRQDVQVFTDPQQRGLVIVGRAWSAGARSASSSIHVLEAVDSAGL
jgi:hypothetical protein